MDLTDAQWVVLEPFFRPRSRPDGRGRPFREARAVLNGVLWVLRTGAPWHDLPARYPPYQTCHRRFQHWQRSGRLDRLLQGLAEDLRDRGKIDLSEAFVDATFASAKRGAAIGPTRRGKGTKVMAIVDRHGLPLAVHVASASPYEPHHVPATLDARCRRATTGLEFRHVPFGPMLVSATQAQVVSLVDPPQIFYYRLIEGLDEPVKSVATVSADDRASHAVGIERAYSAW